MKNKRFICIHKLAAALLALALSLALLGAAAAETYAVVYNTKSLNLRAQASLSSQRLGSYAEGSWVAVTGDWDNFYAVSTFDGKAGYMSKNFLHTTEELTFGRVAIVNNPRTTAFLNLRSYPSYAATVITILYNGVPLTVLSDENGWYRVQMGDTQGYVRSEFTETYYQPLGTGVATIKTPNSTAVNLREAPSSDSSVLRQCAGDQYVSVLYQGTHWWYVCIDKSIGFISSDFLVEGLHAERDEAWQREEEEEETAPAAGGDEAEDAYAMVNNPISTQKLNLRQQPTIASGIVSRLANGTRLTMLAQGTEWCKVYVNSISATGYVMTRFLKYYNLQAVPTVTIVHPYGSYVDLHTEASMTSEVLMQIPDNSTATQLVPGQDWTKIDYEGVTGYVIGYFVSADQ